MCWCVMYGFIPDCTFLVLSYSQLTNKAALTVSDPCAPSHISSRSLPHSPLKLGDLSPTSMSQRSFKQIAKEKFSMPLRDNYQTVKLPHSSHWVITSPPPSLFFSSNETISF